MTAATAFGKIFWEMSLGGDDEFVKRGKKRQRPRNGGSREFGKTKLIISDSFRSYLLLSLEREPTAH